MAGRDSAVFSPSLCLAKGRRVGESPVTLELGPDSSLPLEWCRWARALAFFFGEDKCLSDLVNKHCTVLMKQ